MSTQPMTITEQRLRQEAWERMLALLPAFTAACPEIIGGHVTHARKGRTPVIVACTRHVSDPKKLGGWRYADLPTRTRPYVYISLSEQEVLRRMHDSAAIEGGV